MLLQPLLVHSLLSEMVFGVVVSTLHVHGIQALFLSYCLNAPNGLAMSLDVTDKLSPAPET